MSVVTLGTRHSWPYTFVNRIHFPLTSLDYEVLENVDNYEDENKTPH